MPPRRATARTLAVARGDAPADMVIKGGRVFVPGTRQWVWTDLAVADGVIAGWGMRDAREVVDVAGASLTAAFIDPHMHLESTKLWVDEFVRTVLPHGTTAVAADPHEIANVFGVPGVVAFAAAARELPFTFGICASSCVPASPFESPGAEVGPAELGELLEVHGALGVAEVMNVRGVINGDPEVLAKIAAAGSRRVDGHAPGILGRQLDAYLAAGVESDHECTELEEVEEKRRKGMWIFVPRRLRLAQPRRPHRDRHPSRHRPGRPVHRRPRAGHPRKRRARQRLRPPGRGRRGEGGGRLGVGDGKPG